MHSGFLFFFHKESFMLLFLIEEAGVEFCCDICGKDFAFKRGLRRHIGNVHEVKKGA